MITSPACDAAGVLGHGDATLDHGCAVTAGHSTRLRPRRCSRSTRTVARFEASADGTGDPIAENDLETVPLMVGPDHGPEGERMAGRLPVDPVVYVMAKRHGLVEKYGLVRTGLKY